MNQCIHCNLYYVGELIEHKCPPAWYCRFDGEEEEHVIFANAAKHAAEDFAENTFLTKNRIVHVRGVDDKVHSFQVELYKSITYVAMRIGQPR